MMTSRPVSFGAVFGVTIGLIAFAIVVELLRRPQPVVAAPRSGDTAADGTDASEGATGTASRADTTVSEVP